MIKFFLFLSLALANAAFADCPGRCDVRPGGDPNAHYTCQAAGYNGEQSCLNLASSEGCTWYPGQVIETPAHCDVGPGGNPDAHYTCQAAGYNGEQSCENLWASEGCAWYPAQYTCQ